MVLLRKERKALGMSGSLPRRQVLAGLVGLVFTGTLSDVDASTLPAGLRALLSDFRRCPGLEAHFSEEKNIILLAAPLRSSGKVYFHPPQSLARVVEKPRPSHLVVSRTKIVVKEDNVRKEVDFSDKPALRGLISSLLHVLSGDEERLTADFETHFLEEGAASWRLRLVPKAAALRRLIESLAFSGKALKLSELRVKEANGDETVTRFSDVNEKRKFTKSEIKQYFEI